MSPKGKVVGKFQIDSLVFVFAENGISLDSTIQLFNSRIRTFFQNKIAVDTNLMKENLGKILDVLFFNEVFATYSNHGIRFIYNYYIPKVVSVDSIYVIISHHEFISKVGDPIEIYPFMPHKLANLFVYINQNENVFTALHKNLTNIINADTTETGFPINIIAVTKDSIAWLEKHQPCK